MCAVARRRGGNLAMARVFRTHDDNVRLLLAQQLLVVLISAWIAGRTESALQVGASASLDCGQRRRPGSRVGAGDDIRPPRSNKLMHKLIDVHVSEPDRANPIAVSASVAHAVPSI